MPRHVINIGHDALDNDVGILVFGFVEQFRQCFFGAVALRVGRQRFPNRTQNRIFRREFVPCLVVW